MPLFASAALSRRNWRFAPTLVLLTASPPRCSSSDDADAPFAAIVYNEA
jgi:hypothetical protein